MTLTFHFLDEKSKVSWSHVTEPQSTLLYFRALRLKTFRHVRAEAFCMTTFSKLWNYIYLDWVSKNTFLHSLAFSFQNYESGVAKSMQTLKVFHRNALILDPVLLTLL